MEKLWQKIKSVAKPIEILLYVLFVIVGILLGAAWAFGHVSYLPDFIGNDHSFSWETLVTGLAALIAAIWTVYTMRQQMKQAKDQEENRRKANSVAARALLPFALPSFSEFSKNRIQFLYEISQLNTEIESNFLDITAFNHMNYKKKMDLVGEKEMNILQNYIKFGDRNVNNVLISLIGLYQIERSRFDGEWEDIKNKSAVTKEDVMSRIVDSANLYAFIGSIYDYARSKSETINNLTDFDIKSALIEADDGINNSDMRAICTEWNKNYS